VSVRLINVIKLFVSIIICLSAGWFGSLFTTPAIPIWYAALQKPVFSPPNWLFAPIWTILYILMAIAAWLVWRKGVDKRPVRAALVIFLIQLVLNALWSLVFFGLRSLIGGEIVIIILWIVLLLTILAFWRITKAAALLLVPYLAWITFAAVLNVSVYILNM